MKKLLLSLLIPVIFACGTEDSDSAASLAMVQTPSETIKGTWLTQTRKIEYYNGSGAKLHEDTEDNKGGRYDFSSNQVIIDYGGGMPKDTRPYSISSSSGKSILTLSSTIGPNVEFEITRLTNTNMSWVIEKEHPNNVTYTENGVDKLAQKSKQTYELTR